MPTKKTVEKVPDKRPKDADQVEPVGDRFPYDDKDALGGQPGKSPEHSGQKKKTGVHR